MVYVHYVAIIPLIAVISNLKSYDMYQLKLPTQSALCSFLAIQPLSRNLAVILVYRNFMTISLYVNHVYLSNFHGNSLWEVSLDVF